MLMRLGQETVAPTNPPGQHHTVPSPPRSRGDGIGWRIRQRGAYWSRRPAATPPHCSRTRHRDCALHPVNQERSSGVLLTPHGGVTKHQQAFSDRTTLAWLQHTDLHKTITHHRLKDSLNIWRLTILFEHCNFGNGKH